MGMVFTNIFYAKIIDGKGECHGSPSAMPEAWHDEHLVGAHGGGIFEGTSKESHCIHEADC